MKCRKFNCMNDAFVHVVDGGEGLLFVKDCNPGDIIDCDDPTTYTVLCEQHWDEFSYNREKMF